MSVSLENSGKQSKDTRGIITLSKITLVVYSVRDVRSKGQSGKYKNNRTIGTKDDVIVVYDPRNGIVQNQSQIIERLCRDFHHNTKSGDKFDLIIHEVDYDNNLGITEYFIEHEE